LYFLIIMNRFASAIIAIAALLFSALPAVAGDAAQDSMLRSLPASAATPALAGDSAHARSFDSLNRPAPAAADSTAVAKKPLLPAGGRKADLKRPDSVGSGEINRLKLIKPKASSRHPVALALFMMIFVIGVITMAQQWNPR
jgi:hypothetical protein